MKSSPGRWSIIETVLRDYKSQTQPVAYTGNSCKWDPGWVIGRGEVVGMDPREGGSSEVCGTIKVMAALTLGQ